MVFMRETERVQLPTEILLLRDLNMDELVRKAGKSFEGAKSGYLLLFTLADDYGRQRPAALEYEDRGKRRARPGFWLSRQGSGGTLENSAVVFDPNDHSMTFVDPGLDSSTVSGVRISASLTGVEFSGPRSVFQADILKAKDKAREAVAGANLVVGPPIRSTSTTQ